MFPRPNRRPARRPVAPLPRRLLGLALTAIALGGVGSADLAAPAGAANFDGLGIAPGKIKHVWLIILENKSYDATFTALNDNTYLWHDLPAQGVLLRQYYGTGHFSQDNYTSMVSGQAPISDLQSDCPYYNALSGSISTSGTVKTNPDYGQFVSAVGPNVVAGGNGCVYPAPVQTLFNQFDAAGVSWKGYAQDLGNPDTPRPGQTSADPNHAGGGAAACGAPYAKPGPAPTLANGRVTVNASQPNPGSADPTDQYVPKHFPFPWFESLLDNPRDCNSAHIANLFDPSNGLYHDLQSERTTPAFSWITPNNCSDAHDATCYGNNLSGGFDSPTTVHHTPQNYTGGLYAADIFLRHIIPEIEASPAYHDGGLIDITFDEAFPPFTYTGNSFANSPFDPPDYVSSLASDAAAETVYGHLVHFEPPGPNTPSGNFADGVPFPGPGYNSYLDRPSNCTNPTVPTTGSTLTFSATAECLGGGNHVPPARTDASATAPVGSNQIEDNAIQADDQGRPVTGVGIPSSSTCCYVGSVDAEFAQATAPRPASSGPTAPPPAPANGNQPYTARFELIDVNGSPVPTSDTVNGITLGAETPASDPLYDAYDPTTGGGDTGSVLISPYITPGTVTDEAYNHYSWLRTMEDLFGVASKSAGLDGLGHLGYAAQPGLNDFGADVFNNAGAATTTTTRSKPKPKPTKHRTRSRARTARR